jgi:hypothetical protein
VSKLVPDGLGGVFLSKEPAVFEDQVHEPGEYETVVLLVDSKEVVVPFPRLGMDVGIVECRLLSRRN